MGFSKNVALVVITFTLMVSAVESTHWFSSAKDYVKSSWEKSGISFWNAALYVQLGYYTMSYAYEYYDYYQWMSEYATVLEKEGNVSSWLSNNPPPFGEDPSLHLYPFKRFLNFVDNQVLSTVCEHMRLRRVKGENNSATENHLFRTLCS